MKGNKNKDSINLQVFFKLALLIGLFFQPSLMLNAFAKVKVTTGKIELVAPFQSIDVPGIWVPKNEITVSSAIQASRVKQIFVEEGDYVKAGQPLAELEDDSLKVLVNSAESLLSQVNAKINEVNVHKREAESLFSRAQKLKQANAISQQQFDEISNNVKSLGHQLSAVYAEKKRIEQQVIDAKSQLAKSTVVSPIDGIVSVRIAKLGELTSFSPLFQVYDPNELEFQALVTDSTLTQIKVGDQVKIVAPDNTYINGSVRLVGTQLQKETGIGAVRITPEYKFSGSVGSGARAVFSFGKKKINVIDNQAIRYNIRDTYTYLLDSNNCVIEQPITLGERYLDASEVLSGVEAGQQVILSGSTFLKTGDCVIPQLVESKIQSFNDETKTKHLIHRTETKQETSAQKTIVDTKTNEQTASFKKDNEFDEKTNKNQTEENLPSIEKQHDESDQKEQITSIEIEKDNIKDQIKSLQNEKNIEASVKIDEKTINNNIEIQKPKTNEMLNEVAKQLTDENKTIEQTIKNEKIIEEKFEPVKEEIETEKNIVNIQEEIKKRQESRKAKSQESLQNPTYTDNLSELERRKAALRKKRQALQNESIK